MVKARLSRRVGAVWVAQGVSDHAVQWIRKTRSHHSFEMMILVVAAATAASREVRRYRMTDLS
jgi:hypothetical protein